MDIRFYNFDFEPVHIENHVISSNWTIYNNAIGSFELHFALDSDIVNMFKENLSYPENKMLVAVCGDKQGIVTGVSFGTDCAVFGKTCNWLLSKRAYPPFTTSSFNFDGTPYSLVKHISETAFADVENFRVMPAEGFDDIFTGNAFWRNVYNPVSEVVSDILKLGGGGHSLYFNIHNKSWDLIITRNYSSGLEISADNKNAYAMEHIYEIGSCANDAWYEAEVYDDEKFLIGFEWRSISKNEKSGIYRWESIFSADTSAEVQNSLKKATFIDQILAKIKRLKFGRDFHLGEVVKVIYKCGDFRHIAPMLISGVHIGEANNEISEEIILKEATTDGIQL